MRKEEVFHGMFPSFTIGKKDLNISVFVKAESGGPFNSNKVFKTQNCLKDNEKDNVSLWYFKTNQ